MMHTHKRYLAPVAAALVLVLAGCQTASDKSAGAAGAPASPGQAQPAPAATPGSPATPAAQAAATAAQVGFYIAQTKQEAGLLEVPLQDGKLYVQRTPVLTRGDLVEAAAMVDQQGQNFVGLRFNDAGARKLSEISSKNVGNMLALVINRELVAAPRISEPLDRGVLAFGTPNAQAAAEIAAAIRGDDPAAEPAPSGATQPGAAPAPTVPAQSGS
ncbi:putative lipoprotein [plant metagenome]|uniref:Putative lipoprotein n=1 Tax=plant metagenome TaxID=1297885 RepID=A0A484SX62_9ZZZZ